MPHSKNTEHRNRWKKISTAQVCQHFCPKLRWILPHEHRVWTEQSIRWMRSVKFSWFENGNSSTNNTLATFTKNPRFFWTNGNNFLIGWKACPASLHEVLGILRQENKRVKTERTRLRVYSAARAADQWKKYFFADFHWTSPYVVEKALPNNNG